MAIAGVKTETNQAGHYTSVTIDIQQHQEVLPVLQKMGLIEKTQFEKECQLKNSLTEFKNILTTYHGKNNYF